MKAVRYTPPGAPEVALRVEEVDTPVPNDHEILVRVVASSVNAMEWRMFTLPRLVIRIVGLLSGAHGTKDNSFGTDFAGRVEAVGTSVSDVRPGDEVFGAKKGAFAEFVCVGGDRFAAKPANVSFEAAAAVPVAGLTALQAVRDFAKVRAGEKVLINGAGGGVGTFAVQIAKALGAEVTATCSTRNLERARAIGADHVIDYSREDFTRGGRRYDAIINVNGHQSIFACPRALTADGRYVWVGGALKGMVQTWVGGRRFRGMMANVNRKDLLALKELLEAGRIVPALDRRYSLAEVPAAIRYLMQGHSSGKVIINLEPMENPSGSSRP
jgi:NADPH:quinone reductase-like Zn-dependent oxidoreductase